MLLYLSTCDLSNISTGNRNLKNGLFSVGWGLCQCFPSFFSEVHMQKSSNFMIIYMYYHRPGVFTVVVV